MEISNEPDTPADDLFNCRKEAAKYLYQLLKQLDSSGQPKTKYDSDGRLRTILDIYPKSQEISSDFHRASMLYIRDFSKVHDIACCLGMTEDDCLDILLDGIIYGENINLLPLFLEYGVDAELYKEIRQICSSGISTLSNLLCTVCVSVTKLKVALVGVFTDLSETSVDGIFDEIVASIQASGMSETELVDFFEKESAETTATMKPDHEETYKHILDVVDKANELSSRFDDMVTKMLELHQQISIHAKQEEVRKKLLPEPEEIEDINAEIIAYRVLTPRPYRAVCDHQDEDVESVEEEKIISVLASQERTDAVIIKCETIPTQQHDVTKDVVVEETPKTKLLPPKLETRPPAIFPELKVGDNCFAINRMNSRWYQAKVIGIRNDFLNVWTPGSTSKFSTFVNVRFLGPVDFDKRFYVGPKAGTEECVEPKSVAFFTQASWVLPVKSRIIGFYDDLNSVPRRDWYAGTVAEVPSIRTNHRYLVFFDDGYVQYCPVDQVRLIASRSREGWLDIPDSHVRDFVRNYLLKYPEYPMIRNRKDSTVRVESNGYWWNTRVLETDVSLVKVEFLLQSNPQALAAGVKPVCMAEWLYRGSSRLEPLFKQFSTDKKIRKVVKSTFGAGSNSAALEYVSLASGDGYHREDDSDIRSSVVAGSVQSSSTSLPKPQVARKSTGGAALQRQLENLNRMPLVQDERLFTTTNKVHYTRTRIIYHQHENCGHQCLSANGSNENVAHYRSGRWVNPLILPMLCGWQREVAKFGTKTKRIVVYRAPCGVRLRNEAEVWKFLIDVKSGLTIDMFTFDSSRPYVFAKSVNPLEAGSDYSNNKELYIRIPWVNCCSRYERPPIIDYVSKRFASNQVRLNADMDFVSCCSCQDNCSDKNKCECQKLTIKYASMVGPNYHRNKNAGYEHRRLLTPLVSGIFECNEGCSCDDRCLNKVVQFPMQVRLEIFKTKEKGWGVRAVDDLPRGTFVCTYSGQIHTETEANHMGIKQGDEYHAGLDYLEVLDAYMRERNAELRDSGLITRVDQKIVRFSPIHESDSNDSVAMTKLSSNSCSSDIDCFNASQPTEVKVISDGYSQGCQTPSSGITKTSSSNCGDSASCVSMETEDLDNQSLRMQLFNEDDCYTIDGKSHGNVGRYFNHSCTPNLVVQSVFVDTHDLRFPWVSFFTSQRIRAGTELCWDYGYTVDSVPGKKIYCRCRSIDCRRRLL